MHSPKLTRMARSRSLPLKETLLANKKRLIILLCTFIFIAYIAGLSPPQLTKSLPIPNIHKWIPDAAYFLGLRNRPGIIVHPIPKLMVEAQTKYKGMLASQSKTVAQAAREYRRRYKRDPPKGFDEWFAFAKENGAIIIDEYDQLVGDLEPFWQFDGTEIRRRAVQVGSLPSIDLVRLVNGKAITVNIEKGFEDSEVSARAKGFRVMIEKFQAKLPDMDFPINAKAEGRVLVPWEHVHYPNMTEQDSSMGVEHMLNGKFVADWQGDSNVWEAFRRTCPPSSQARRLYQSMRALLKEGQRPVDLFEKAGLVAGPDEDFQFSKSVDDRYDFCQHPHAHTQQGHFFSDWRTIPVLYPIFSPAKGEGYSDILVPSHYYYSSTKRYTYGWDPVSQTVKDVDDNEQPWIRKTNKIFWRGATTGGGSSPPGYLASYQRHRLLRMTSDRGDGNRTVIFADPPGTDNFVFAKVPIAHLNKEFTDAAFTKAIACVQYPGGCDALRREHRFAEAVPLGEHWRHKFLIDVDGMGYSARLFAFLASDSAVIKSTVYREYFSDWIQPWLHYIPLSQGYNELYNIHAYFAGPSAYMTSLVSNATSSAARKKNPRELDGDKQLHRIARAGRQWKATVGRKVDMEIYVYRLCLEWARLWADDREAMSFKG